MKNQSVTKLNPAEGSDLQFLLDFLTRDDDQNPCSLSYPKIHQEFVKSALLYFSIELLNHPEQLRDLFDQNRTELSEESFLASAERFLVGTCNLLGQSEFDHKTAGLRVPEIQYLYL